MSVAENMEPEVVPTNEPTKDEMLTPEEKETLERLLGKQLKDRPLQVLPQRATLVHNINLTPLNIRTVQTIGLLDRALSELKMLALDSELDAADTQTVKHHAEDCIGLGQKVLEILKREILKRDKKDKPPKKEKIKKNP